MASAASRGAVTAGNQQGQSCGSCTICLQEEHAVHLEARGQVEALKDHATLDQQATLASGASPSAQNPPRGGLRPPPPARQKAQVSNLSPPQPQAPLRPS